MDGIVPSASPVSVYIQSVEHAVTATDRELFAFRATRTRQAKVFRVVLCLKHAREREIGGECNVETRRVHGSLGSGDR